MLSKLKQVLIALGALVVVFAIGYGTALYTRPAKVEYKDKIVYKEGKTITKVIYRTRVVTVTKTVDVTKKPDGTVVTHTETHTNDQTGTSSTTNEKDKKKVDDNKSLVEINNRPNWQLHFNAGYSLHHLNGLNPRMYGVEVDRRILGPFWLGGWGNTQGDFGASIGFEF